MFFEIVFAGIVLANVCNICAPFVPESKSLNTQQLSHIEESKFVQCFKRARSNIMIIPQTAAMLITVPLFIASRVMLAGMIGIEQKIKRTKKEKARKLIQNK